MKIKILTGLYEGMTGRVVSSDTSEGYPRVYVLVDIVGKRICLHLDEIAYL